MSEVQDRAEQIQVVVRVLMSDRIGTDDGGVIFPDEARIVAEDIVGALHALKSTITNHQEQT